MATGTIKWFNDAKGFGFITPDGESSDVFVHYSNIIGQSGRRTLVEGERVEYEVFEGPKGLQAPPPTPGHRPPVAGGGPPPGPHLHEAAGSHSFPPLLSPLKNLPLTTIDFILCGP